MALLLFVPKRAGNQIMEGQGRWRSRREESASLRRQRPSSPSNPSTAFKDVVVSIAFSSLCVSFFPFSFSINLYLFKHFSYVVVSSFIECTTKSGKNQSSLIETSQKPPHKSPCMWGTGEEEEMEEEDDEEEEEEGSGGGHWEVLRIGGVMSLHSCSGGGGKASARPSRRSVTTSSLSSHDKASVCSVMGITQGHKSQRNWADGGSIDNGEASGTAAEEDAFVCPPLDRHPARGQLAISRPTLGCTGLTGDSGSPSRPWVLRDSVVTF